jgi:hypothetical protein
MHKTTYIIAFQEGYPQFYAQAISHGALSAPSWTGDNPDMLDVSWLGAFLLDQIGGV